MAKMIVCVDFFVYLIQFVCDIYISWCVSLCVCVCVCVCVSVCIWVVPIVLTSQLEFTCETHQPVIQVAPTCVHIGRTTMVVKETTKAVTLARLAFTHAAHAVLMFC